MLSYIVPGTESFSVLGDAATSSFLLSRAETWSEFGPDDASTLIQSCCADAARRLGPTVNEPRYRAGSAITSVLDLHPDRVPGNAEFRPLYDYIVALPSHKRLATVQQRRATLDYQAIRVRDLTGEPLREFEVRHARAWNTGVVTWIFNDYDLF